MVTPGEPAQGLCLSSFHQTLALCHTVHPECARTSLSTGSFSTSSQVMGFVPKTLLFNPTCFPLTRNSHWWLQACQGFFWYFRQHSEKKKNVWLRIVTGLKNKKRGQVRLDPIFKEKIISGIHGPSLLLYSAECRSLSLEAALYGEAPNIPTRSLSSPASSPPLWGFQWKPLESAENFQSFIKMNLNPLSLTPRSSSTGQPLGMHLGSDSIDEREIFMRWEEPSAMESWDVLNPLQRLASSCVAVVPMVPKLVHPQRSFTQKSCPLGMFLLILPMTGNLGKKNQKTCSKTFCRNLRCGGAGGDGPETEGIGHFKWMVLRWGFPGGASGKEFTCQCRHKRCGFDPWVRKIPWRTAWQCTPVFLPGEPRGQRSLAGYSPWGCKESDTTEVT